MFSNQAKIGDMDERVLKRIDELEKRVDELLKKLQPLAGYKAKAMELEQKLKALSENLAREKALREDTEKAREEKVSGLDSKARALEEKLTKEKRLREEAADRVQRLIRQLEEEGMPK